jgi:hypothetical protein
LYVEFDGETFHLAGGKKKTADWRVDGLKIGTNALPNGRFLTIARVRVDGGWAGADRSKTCYMTAAGSLEFSAAAHRPNYRYVRLGHGSARKLGDLLPAKISPTNLPVIFRGGEICWVPHLPVVDFFRVKDGEGDALLLTYP